MLTFHMWALYAAHLGVLLERYACICFCLQRMKEYAVVGQKGAVQRCPASATMPPVSVEGRIQVRGSGAVGSAVGKQQTGMS